MPQVDPREVIQATLLFGLIMIFIYFALGVSYTLYGDNARSNNGRRNNGRREHYGAANEPRAGLNPATPLDKVPGHGWPSFYLSGYRADSASALSHMQLRD